MRKFNTPFNYSLKNTSDRFSYRQNRSYYQLVFALMIGVITGLTGAIFRLSLEKIAAYIRKLHLYFSETSDFPWIYISLIAALFIYLSLFLVKKFAREASGSGIQEIEGALDELRPLRWKRIIPVKFFASLFSLNSGLLLGREGPTIQIGASIGKMFKDLFHLEETENNPFISTGAAAGLASAFNAPFSGIIFVIEEMHEHFKFNFFSVACIMTGAASSDLIVRWLVGSEASFQIGDFDFTHLSAVWLFFAAGILYGFIGYFFNKSMLFVLDLFQSIRKYPIFMSLGLGLLITFTGIYYPDMIRSGYETIFDTTHFNYDISLLIFILNARIVLTIISYSSGVPGGIFAPLLSIGVVSGMLFGLFAQTLFPSLVSDPAIFAIAGMAGIFSSIVKAPITGLVLAVEMTSNFELILPLLVITIVSSVTTTLLGNQPIYTSLLKRTLEQTRK